MNGSAEIAGPRGSAFITFAGTWRLEGTQLRMKLETTNRPDIYALPSEEVQDVVSVTTQALTTRDVDGKVDTATR